MGMLKERELRKNDHPVAPAIPACPSIRDRQSSLGTEASVHRSRLPMLVIFAAAAACTTRDDSKGTTDDSLSKDPTLVARLDAGKQPGQPLPDG